MSVASAVSRRRRGFTLRHSLVPMRRPGGTAAVLSAKAKDFRGGRNGERGEIASSTSGGRGIDEHSPKAKRPILTDKSLMFLFFKFIYGENNETYHYQNN